MTWLKSGSFLILPWILEVFFSIRFVFLLPQQHDDPFLTKSISVIWSQEDEENLTLLKHIFYSTIKHHLIPDLYFFIYIFPVYQNIQFHAQYMMLLLYQIQIITYFS